MATTLTAFAAPAQLSVRLGVAAPTAATTAEAQMLAALDDASNDLRAIIGQAINEGRTTITQRVQPGAYLRLPAVPATDIHSVTDTESGVAVEYELVDVTTLHIAPHYVPTYKPREVLTSRDETSVRVSVDYTHGWATIPGELVRWTCVLAAASLAAAKSGNLGLAGGLSSIRVDDSSASWATRTGEQGMGITIPDTVQAKLRARYGMSAMALEHR